MESSVLLRSTGMIRSVAGGATALPSSGRHSVELSKIRARASIVDSRRSKLKQSPLAGMRSFNGAAVKRSATTSITCTAQSSSTPYSEDFVKPHPEIVEENGSVAADEATENQLPIKHEQQQQQQQQQKSAKIHDFCFGIPFGGAVLISGIVGFIIARDVTALCNSILFGGALLGLSTTSLKVWRQGESSFRYILGQAVIAAIVLWNGYQGYLLTKKIFPHTLNAAVSAAMLCFYSYVVISGGNPPPKKLKART